ncbi:MAG TPA: hypothetical protein VF411_06455 [Bacteroidia bacterium]
MRKLLLITISLLSFGFYGQSIDISIFNFTNDTYGAFHWASCNKEGLFFKADTLIFTTGDCKCCEYITIEIKGKKLKSLSENDGCQEPPMKTLFLKAPTGYIKKIDSDYYLYLTIFRDSVQEVKEKFFLVGRKKEKQKFKILELTKHREKDNFGITNRYEMKLVKT